MSSKWAEFTHLRGFGFITTFNTHTRPLCAAEEFPLFSPSDKTCRHFSGVSRSARCEGTGHGLLVKVRWDKSIELIGHFSPKPSLCLLIRWNIFIRSYSGGKVKVSSGNTTTVHFQQQFLCTASVLLWLRWDYSRNRSPIWRITDKNKRKWGNDYLVAVIFCTLKISISWRTRCWEKMQTDKKTLLLYMRCED